MGIDSVGAALTSQYVQNLLSIKSYQLCRRPSFRQWERPDIEQDLVAHVLKQAHHFDPSRASVNTFIARVVDSAFAMMVRDRRRLKRAAGFRTESLDSPVVAESGHRTTTAALLGTRDLRRHSGIDASTEQQQTDLRIDVAQAMAGLTPQQWDIATRLANAPEADVARQLNISRRQVRNAVLAIRERFEKASLRKSKLSGQSALGRHK
jgi:RNA polymerase sigma factor (sigma-70 family)